MMRIHRLVRARTLAVSLTLALPAAAGAATQTTPPHPAHQTAPAAGPPAELFDNLGSYSHPISTHSAEAQRYFDQGLSLLYGFNHDEAERSFREAARRDPECGICWWGVALTLGPNINLPIDPERNARAVEAIDRARSLAGTETEAERAYITALATRYSRDPHADRAALDQSYARAMRELSLRYPDDLDAATLYAEAMMDLRPWKLWTPDGAPEEGTEAILATLESVMRRNPNHPGANHYYIHAVEASNQPERAAASAERLPALVPGAGHLVHMPAHIQMRTGDYRGAVDSNDRAARVDEEYLKRSGSSGTYPTMYYNHNLHFLALAAMMTGEHARAARAAEQVSASVAGLLPDMQMVEFSAPTNLLVAVRFGRWDEVLTAKEPAHGLPTSRAIRHYARGVAYAAKGELAAAKLERQALAAARAVIPAEHVWNIQPAAPVIRVAAEVLDARIAAAEGARDAALAAWRRAVEAQDALAYDQPPAWYYPVRESLGAEMMQTGRPAEAEQVFRDDLKRNPANPRSLLGLAESLAAQDRVDAAAAARREFDAAWKRADVTVTLKDF